MVVAEGFIGTEEEWRVGLVDPDGKAATITVGEVTPVEIGSETIVTNIGDETAAMLDFKIQEVYKVYRFSLISNADTLEILLKYVTLCIAGRDTKKYRLVYSEIKNFERITEDFFILDMVLWDRSIPPCG